MRAVLIGGNGQLGTDLVVALRKRGHEVVSLTHSQIEVTDSSSVEHVLGQLPHDVLINTSAYHRVDDAEQVSSLAFEVNALGPKNLGGMCLQTGAALVHLSTDYVFSGSKRAPYLEDDQPDPINVYGVSKVAGEMVVRYVLPSHYIVRTSGLYGVAGSSGKGGNFVETMLRIACEDQPIRVVNDQTLTPTSTESLAAQIAMLIETRDFGTYHATCEGECNWFEFASEIFRQSGLVPDIAPQSTAESGATARRPVYSVLENNRLEKSGVNIMPKWQDALSRYLEVRKTKAE